MDETFFLRLAEGGPFAILDGRVYQASDEAANGTSLNVGPTTLGLVQAAHVNDLENFYRQLQATEIEGVMNSYLQARVQKEVKTQRELKRFLGDNQTVQFLVYEVFPHFMEKDDDLDEMIQAQEEGRRAKRTEDTAGIEEMINGGETGEVTLADVQRLKRDLIDEIEQEYRQQEGIAEPTPEPRKRATEEMDELDALLTTHYQNQGILEPEPTQRKEEKIELGEGLLDILGTGDVLVMNGDVYKLIGSRADSDISVKAGRKRMIPQYVARATSIEEAYQRFLEKSVKIAAVEQLEDQVKQIEEARKKFRGIEGIAQQGEFRAGDVGFLQRNGEYYVFLQVPKFAMKHPKREQYFTFEPCRVGVRVNYSGGQLHSADKPVVIEAYRHPFLQGGGAFQGICNLSGWGNRYDPAMQVVKKLSDAKNVIMNGMTIKSFRSHGGTDIHDSHYWSDLLKDKLNGREITKKEAERQGYIITNFLWAGGNNGR
jgi:hypothetical protein